MTFEEEMLEQVKERLRQFVGVAETGSDAERVRFEKLHEQYEFWKRKVAEQQGMKPTIATIDMSGC